MDNSILFSVAGFGLAVLGASGGISWRSYLKSKDMKAEFEKSIEKVEKDAKEGREKIEKKLHEHEQQCEHRIEECYKRINEMASTEHVDRQFDKLGDEIKGLAGNIAASTAASEKRWSDTNARLDQLLTVFANRASNGGNANTTI